MLTPRQKDRIIKKHNLHDADTGSPEVQVALLSDEIKRLTLHLKKHPKDHSSRRGLLKMVAKRKSLLDYLREKNARRYNKLAKALGLA
ncbi:MAG: 30S ribosomal protein S15 [Candidatus Terrybacteria bacterium RIFCSPHIGHO2_01_FULL_48_17]|uniref:Small ribosomal subunit protein uS15 n=1 Tax=Candidatus Terrybacteria bacterium RIFCSPHIGHO2_01_FULL_48_17 TaxID=1802362 RepID=A0A1G2PK39_9BACT|nr:MAG: 30S ribosomal protein S15 [Candidatus Terrybacteria bacterium RIFCSPHIGHO2_01_FULL_48_17]OHA51901.1 MAG: 30S ribosomal protein S15 [Candidatus Terrybacteria bacterium RIFCSPLOWO2_01_FULL_48_14]